MAVHYCHSLLGIAVEAGNEYNIPSGLVAQLEADACCKAIN